MKQAFVIVAAGLLLAALAGPASASHLAHGPAWDPGHRLTIEICEVGEYLDLDWRVDLAYGLGAHEYAFDNRVHTAFAVSDTDGHDLDDSYWTVPATNIVTAEVEDDNSVVIYRAIYPTRHARPVSAWVHYGDGSTDRLSLDKIRCIDPVTQTSLTARYGAEPGQTTPNHDDATPGNEIEQTPATANGSGVEPAPDGRLIVSGPHLVAGNDYTGRQLGDRFFDGDGHPYPTSWPSYTRPQGQLDHGWAGIEALDTDMMRLTLTRAGHPSHSATTLMEQHLHLDQANPSTGGLRQVSITFDVAHRSGESFRTLKNPGLVGFNNPDWVEWPGGGHHGNQNFSVRVVQNSDDGNGPRWSAYLYLGPLTGAQDITYAGSPNPRFTIDNGTANVGRTVEIVARNGPPIKPDTLYSVRLEADAGTPGQHNGSLRYLVKEEGADWVEVMHLTKIMWALDGAGLWTRAYPVVMYGGRDASFAPQNPEGTGIVDIGRIRVHELEATVG
ncbi:MAG: hypothetical protein GY939_21710 [Actinomycetia bacterium]|nr:hypothetical protein [Actinomycetes bacterium]